MLCGWRIHFLGWLRVVQCRAQRKQTDSHGAGVMQRKRSGSRHGNASLFGHLSFSVRMNDSVDPRSLVTRLRAVWCDIASLILFGCMAMRFFVAILSFSIVFVCVPWIRHYTLHMQQNWPDGHKVRGRNRIKLYFEMFFRVLFIFVFLRKKKRKRKAKEKNR